MGNRNKKLSNKPVQIASTSLYELNKINMKQIEPVDDEWLKKKCNEVATEIYKEHYANSHYWMLLCRERYDFTLWNLIPTLIDKTVPLAKEIYTCLTNRGQVIDFTKQENGSYEIWIRDTETQENFAYYFFDYSLGVIEV